MKTTRLLSTLLLSIGAVTMQQASAAPVSGTITFTGALVADTCNVNGGPLGIDFTVTLPQVQTSTLTAAGQVAGATPFALALTDCPANVNVRTKFTAGAAGIANGRLTNTGIATNVDIQLLNAADAALDLAGATAQAQGDPTVLTDATGAATLNYKAQYYATGATTAGSVLSNVVYEIVYD